MLRLRNCFYDNCGQQNILIHAFRTDSELLFYTMLAILFLAMLAILILSCYSVCYYTLQSYNDC